MMKARGTGATILVAATLAACSGGNDAEGNAAPQIAPGIYSNVVASAGSSDLSGIELFLPQGSNSDQVEFTRCDGRCTLAAQLPIRQGFGGISFDHPGSSASGHAATMAVQPAVNAITLTVDWGDGLQTYELQRVDRRFGLNGSSQSAGNAPDLDLRSAPMPANLPAAPNRVQQVVPPIPLPSATMVPPPAAPQPTPPHP